MNTGVFTLLFLIHALTDYFPIAQVGVLAWLAAILQVVLAVILLSALLALPASIFQHIRAQRTQQNKRESKPKKPLHPVLRGIDNGLDWYLSGADRGKAFFAVSILSLLAGLGFLVTGLIQGKAQYLGGAIVLIPLALGTRFLIDLFTGAWRK